MIAKKPNFFFLGGGGGGWGQTPVLHPSGSVHELDGSRTTNNEKLIQPVFFHMDLLTSFWYVSHRRAANAHTSLRIRTISSQP